MGKAVPNNGNALANFSDARSCARTSTHHTEQRPLADALWDVACTSLASM